LHGGRLKEIHSYNYVLRLRGWSLRRPSKSLSGHPPEDAGWFELAYSCKEECESNPAVTALMPTESGRIGGCGPWIKFAVTQEWGNTQVQPWVFALYDRAFACHAGVKCMTGRERFS
jgi:hypothetical protein